MVCKSWPLRRYDRMGSAKRVFLLMMAAFAMRGEKLKPPSSLMSGVPPDKEDKWISAFSP